MNIGTILFPALTFLVGYYFGQYNLAKSIKKKLSDLCLKVTNTELMAGTIFDHIRSIELMSDEERAQFLDSL